MKDEAGKIRLEGMISLAGAPLFAASFGRIPGITFNSDYALSYLLAGIVAKPDLSGALIFKGVTALKKLNFRDHHLSEDLDFSAVNAPLFPPDAQLSISFYWHESSPLY